MTPWIPARTVPSLTLGGLLLTALAVLALPLWQQQRVQTAEAFYAAHRPTPEGVAQLAYGTTRAREHLGQRLAAATAHHDAWFLALAEEAPAVHPRVDWVAWRQRGAGDGQASAVGVVALGLRLEGPTELRLDPQGALRYPRAASAPERNTALADFGADGGAAGGPARWEITQWLALIAATTSAIAWLALRRVRARKIAQLRRRELDHQRELAQLLRERQALQEEQERLLEQNRCLATAAQEAERQARDAREALGRLQDSEWVFRASFERALTPMALFEPKSGLCVRVNQAFCQLLGYSSDELLGMDFSAITHPADQGLTPPLVRSALRGEPDAFAIDKRYLHRGGRVVWCRVSCALLRDRQGKPLYLSVQAHTLASPWPDAAEPPSAFRPPAQG